MNIHPTAIVEPGAKLHPSVQVGPWSYIKSNVTIDAGTVVGSHAVISGPTHIGENNKIFQFSCLGEDPQDKKYSGADGETFLKIGADNIFREFTTINRGTVAGGGETIIGNDNLFMAYVHVAHDCRIGSHTVFSNNSQLAGHVTIEDHVILSGFVGVHQFCTIGARAFLAGGSMVVKDVPPFMIVAGHPAKTHGINTVGLKRAGFSEQVIDWLRRAYKILYRQSMSVDSAVSKLEEMVADVPHVGLLIDFIKNRSARGLVRE